MHEGCVEQESGTVVISDDDSIRAFTRRVGLYVERQGAGGKVITSESNPVRRSYKEVSVVFGAVNELVGHGNSTTVLRDVEVIGVQLECGVSVAIAVASACLLFTSSRQYHDCSR